MNSASERPLRLLVRLNHEWKDHDTSHEALIRLEHPETGFRFPSCEVTLWTWGGLDANDRVPAAGEVLVLNGDPSDLTRSGRAERRELEFGVGVHSYPDEDAVLRHLSEIISQQCGQELTLERTFDIAAFTDHPRGQMLARLAELTADLPTTVDDQGNVYFDLHGEEMQELERNLMDILGDSPDETTENTERKAPLTLN